MTQDEQHVRLLSIFQYVLGGITAFFACFPFIHVAMGIAMLSGAFTDQSGQGPPEFVGWIVIAMGSAFILAGWTLAALMIAAGRKLQRRRARTFCMVVGGIECILMPLGTVLGVFTIIVLTKDPVRRLFEPGDRDSPAAGGQQT